MQRAQVFIEAERIKSDFKDVKKPQANSLLNHLSDTSTPKVLLSDNKPNGDTEGARDFQAAGAAASAKLRVEGGGDIGGIDGSAFSTASHPTSTRNKRQAEIKPDEEGMEKFLCRIVTEGYKIIQEEAKA